MKTVGVVAVALLVTSGCATIRGGAVRDVKLTSEPPGASVEISDPNGHILFTGSTPTLARLKIGAGYFRPAQYTASFRKPGRVSYSIPLRTHVDWFLYVIGNIPLGFFPGVIWIDPGTGAMWSFEREIHVALNPEREDGPTVER